MPLDKMILKTNMRSFDRKVGEYIVYLAQLKGKLSIEVSKLHSPHVSRFEIIEEQLPEEILKLYGTVENLYDYMAANETCIVSIEREKIVLRNYLNKNSAIELIKGSTLLGSCVFD